MLTRLIESPFEKKCPFAVLSNLQENFHISSSQILLSYALKKHSALQTLSLRGFPAPLQTTEIIKSLNICAPK